jgi:hypothetical protein
LTLASAGAGRLHEAMMGTRTDAHVSASNQRPKELNDVKQQTKQNDLKQAPVLTGSAGLFNECALGHFLIFTFPK